jgi:hypothetical protein
MADAAYPILILGWCQGLNNQFDSFSDISITPLAYP